MDYNYYKYSKHIYILIQAPYNTDIYKISMKMKPVWQIMYSVNVMVRSFFFFWCKIPKGTPLTDINCQRGKMENIMASFVWKASTEKKKEKRKKKKCWGEERHQHNNSILSF